MLEKEVNPELLNKVKERLLNVSPTVKMGLEHESDKSDFFRCGDYFFDRWLDIPKVLMSLHRTRYRSLMLFRRNFNNYPQISKIEYNEGHLSISGLD